jgi:putative FmdB family regulatory protein
VPIFSYICKDCGSKSDLLVGVTSKDEERICKKCGSRNIEKSITSFGVNISSGKSDSGLSGPSCPTGTCPTGY